MAILYNNGFDWLTTLYQLKREVVTAAYNTFGGYVTGVNGIGQAFDGTIENGFDGYTYDTVCFNFHAKTGFNGFGEFINTTNVAGGFVQTTVETLGDGRIQIRDGSGSSVVPGFMMLTGTWYYFNIKLWWTYGGGTRTVNYSVYVNNVLIQTSSFSYASGQTQTETSWYRIGRYVLDNLIVTDGEVIPEQQFYPIYPSAIGDSTMLLQDTIVPRRRNASVDTGSPLYTNMIALWPTSEGQGVNVKNVVSLVDYGVSTSLWGGLNPTGAFNYLFRQGISVGFGGGYVFESSFATLSSSQGTFVIKTYTKAVTGRIDMLYAGSASILFSVNTDRSFTFTLYRATSNLVVQTAPGSFPLFTLSQIAVTWDGTTLLPSDVHIYIDQVEVPHSIESTGSGAALAASSFAGVMGVNSVTADLENPDNLLFYASLHKNRILSTSEMLDLDTPATFPLTGGTPVTFENYNIVQDHSPDDFASMLIPSALNDKDLWNMDNVPSGTIYVVGGRTCASKTAAGPSGFKALTKVSATEYEEPEFFPSYGSWLYQNFRMRKNPITLNDFTPTEVNAIQRGFKCTTL